ncbi:MAG: ankyrin repeat domain-containing protein [Armatimonadetes bacterium]|nr:ankyrin repeat domain-containing protein [Armatimonadota bacterium]
MRERLSDQLFALAEAGDAAGLLALLDADPGLLHVRRVLPDTTRAEERPTLLQAAATAGHLPLVQALAERGVDLYERGQWGYPAVVHAAWAKQDAVVAWLLGDATAYPSLGGEPCYGLGVEINLAGRMGWTDIVRAHLARDRHAANRRGLLGDVPLHWAAHNNQVDIVAALLAAGADLEADEIGLYGGRPLHWAAEHAPACVALLLAAGADPNARNALPGELEGVTPLIMCALQHNDEAECARLLLNGGADPSLRGLDGLTALETAERCGHGRVAAAIRDAGGSS